MAENKGDILARAYARLQSLGKNIAGVQSYHVEEKYVQEYHEVLSKLEVIGIDISDFRIPDSLVKPIITSSSTDVYGTSKHSYSEEKYVERTLLLIKIDSVIGYFEIVISEKPKNIGFHTSKD